MKEKAVIAMSGGVDSSVAAALMLRQGCDCIGVTLKLYGGEDSEGPAGSNSITTEQANAGGQRVRPPRGCCSLADVNDARQAAYKLGMPHYVLNFTEGFRSEVIRRFVETYEN
ncbi:MAG: hypothetical protein LBT39_09320, partial [Treponema sp.]|nr:hypothetical protein [Treponema sp.]